MTMTEMRYAPAASEMPAPPAPLETSGRRKGARLGQIGLMLARGKNSDRSIVLLPLIAYAIVTAITLTIVGGAIAVASIPGDMQGAYQVCVIVAVALLVLPVTSLGAQAARLSAKRRDDRLASLRLLGASGGAITRLTVVESAVVALVGSLAGCLLYLALMPLVGLIPFDGRALGAVKLWTGVPIMLVVLASLVILAIISSVVGLRQVVVTPLGVRTRQNAPKVHWMRAVLALVVLVIVGVAASVATHIPVAGVAFGVVGAAIFGGMAVINILGPLVVRVFALVGARRATKPHTLLAARGVLDAPKETWRQLSSIPLIAFFSVFLGSGVALLQTASAEGSSDAQGMSFVADAQTGLVIVVVASFILATCSIGVNQASVVLDRRAIYVSLDRFGMARRTIERARRRQVMAPLIFLAILGAVCACVVLLPLVGAALVFSPLSFLSILVTVVLGIGLAYLGVIASTPMMTAIYRRGIVDQ